MKTHITFVLDSSRSMSSFKKETVAGFNTFLEEQQNGPGTATVTLYDFSSNLERVYQGYPIGEAPKLSEPDYTPSGRPALHDAVSTAVTETADYVTKRDPESRPETVIVAVLTDGKENASEPPQKKVREQMEARREPDDWEFLFIGAKEDAALRASGLGMDADRSKETKLSGDGVRAALSSASNRISELRREGTNNDSNNVYEALNHPRRRYLCYTLFADAEWTLSDLATKVAAWEEDVPEYAVADKQRDKVYTSLYQAHVPKLVEQDIVTFDESTETIVAAENADKALDVLEERGTNCGFNQEVHAQREITRNGN